MTAREEVNFHSPIPGPEPLQNVQLAHRKCEHGVCDQPFGCVECQHLQMKREALINGAVVETATELMRVVWAGVEFDFRALHVTD